MLAALCFSGGVAFGLDPEKAITQYHQDVWSERDGLPQGSVQAITQTRDGYLWVGTRDGLARFDGVSFTIFQAEEYPGLRSNDIRALYEDREGKLWIGTFNGGVSCLQDGVFIGYGEEDGLPGEGVLAIFEDKAGRIWLGTWNGLACYDGRAFRQYGEADGLNGTGAWSICTDKKGVMWVGTERGVHRFNGERFEFEEIAGMTGHALRRMVIDREDRMWLGTIGGGVAIWKGGELKRVVVGDGLADNKVRELFEDQHGNMWIGTWAGISRYWQGGTTSYTREDGLPHDFIDALFEDREGSLWIGTRGGGLVRLRDGKFAVYTMNEGLAGSITRSIRQSKDGTIWIASDGGGLSRFRDGTFKNYRTRDGLPSNFVWSLAEDGEGTLWIGTGHPGRLCRFRNGQFTVFGPEHGLSLDYGVRAVYADRAGDIWVGGSGAGLHRFRDGTFELFTMADGLLSPLVRVIAEDREGNLWVGTNGGLCRYKDGKFTGYTTGDGLSHNAVYAIHEDSEGVLWLGTQSGLTVYREGQFRAYTTQDGLYQNIIFQVLEDDGGELWISSNRGVFRLSKKAVADFDAGKIDALPCVGYSVADGLKTTQCEGGTQPSGWRSSDGRLWFATGNGVAMIDPKSIRNDPRPPPVLIEQFYLGDKALELKKPLRLAPGSRELRFHYTALSFAAPEKVQFRYKLEGVDSDWINAGTRRVAFYNEIPPGTHRFRVIACNSDGVWNEQGAQLAFVLEPHFYQTFWFYAICAVVVGMTGWTWHWRRMQAAHAEFSLVLAERSRIARELHDTLAQGFAGIAFQLEAVATKLTEAPTQAQRHLNVALNMVRHSLSEARRSVMNLRSPALEAGDLASALRETATQMIADKEMQVCVETVGETRALPPKIEDQLLRIGQEAITNSFRHADAGLIQIRIEYATQRVVMLIEDDGRGFEIAELAHANGEHFGLLGMRERAKQMGADLTVESDPGVGTRVRVEVPLRNLALKQLASL